MKAVRLCAALAATAVACGAQESFKRADSGRPFSHHVELLDAAGRKIDPRDPNAPPFSSAQTCKKCHDVATIAHGWHFAAATATTAAGRPGEPWLLVDARTGTQIPLSYRGWPGTRAPESVGVDPLQFVQEFGRQLAGGIASYTGATVDGGRFRLTGDLPIDCMICHTPDRAWSHERWAKTIAGQDFAWASAVAMGVATIEGSVKALPDDVDPSTPEGQAKLPRTTYDPARIEPDGHVFFDVVRTPPNTSCMTCHSAWSVGADATPRWLHDDDVHVRAGIACADCHRNGIDHATVRGYPNEPRADGADVSTLTCRGCHLDETDGHGNVAARGGRLGAPLPQHRGLPLIHLEKLSCTACHAGPRPRANAGRAQTSRSHGLGVPSQTRGPDDLPGVANAIWRRNADGVIEPVRMTWPAFFGFERAGRLEPIAPDAAFKTVRRTLRVRTDLRAEFATPEAAATFDEKLAKTLAELQKDAPEGAVAVQVSGGRVRRLDAAGTAITIGTHADAAPYAWAVGHDVRPARDALGARGCTECHAADAPFVHGVVAALGPAPDAAPPTTTMLELMQLDPTLVDAWEQSFAGRDAFKVTGVVAAAIVGLVLLLHLLVGLDAIGRRLVGRRNPTGDAR